ncbi:MAG: hypothetical protein Q7U03_09350 [Syntrophales bacterium]|nr:hypothetical protein [Syntrophales bacterium]
MLRKKTLIFCLLLALMTLTTSRGQCENWKEYFKDSDGTWQYDKDSIHYPKTKKNILGLTVRNKDIVNVWTRNINEKNENVTLFGAELVNMYCVERECIGDGCSWESKHFPNRRLPIAPGSLGESLLKKVCP